MLFTNDHKLNYDEAVRRIAFWTNELRSGRSEQALGALEVLTGVLERNRDNLYFEPNTIAVKGRR